jgi:hypothetical protein
MNIFKWIMDFINGLRNYDLVPQKNTAAPRQVKTVFVIPADTADWDGIVWHHSASKDNPFTNDWDGIRKYHMSWRIDGNVVTEAVWTARKAAGQGHKFEKPWKDIGYHLGIERTAAGLEVKIGRSWAIAGAHAGFPGNNTYNEDYLGCCMIGDFDTVPPSVEEMELCLDVTRQIMAHFNIPVEEVLGHREVYDRVGVPREKTCPGTAINLDELRAKL